MSTTKAAPAFASGVSVSSRDRLLGLADDASRRGSTAQPAEEATYWELQALRLTISAALQPPEPRADAPPEIQEGWYEIELMGHRTRVGYIRPVVFAGRGLVEIREPEHTGADYGGGDRTIPEKVEYYSPAAIFALSPSTEQEVLEDLRDRDFIPF